MCVPPLPFASTAYSINLFVHRVAVMMSPSWNAHRAHYDFLIIGSGYGGAIAAARLATAKVSPRPSICVLERGREWPIGSFPDTVPEILRERRGPLNPLGLYDLLTFPDISVIKGNGLGGTSLVNANVAMVPESDVFRLAGWPASLSLDALAERIVERKIHQMQGIAYPAPGTSVAR